MDGPYQWLHKLSKEGKGISLETPNPYLACSSESKDGIARARTGLVLISMWRGRAPPFPVRWLLRRHQRLPHDLYLPLRVHPGKTMQKEIYARGPASVGLMPLLFSSTSQDCVHKGRWRRSTTSFLW